MTERGAILGCAFVLILVALAAMASMHDRHYQARRWRLLEARLSALESSWLGEH